MKKLLSSLVIFALVVSFSTSGISEEARLPVLPGMEPKLVIVEGEISITKGWNLIAMPVLPVEPYTVKRLINDIERPISPSDWRVLAVAVYKDGQFKKLPPEGYSYNMVPGEAYFVYAEYLGNEIFKRPPRKTVKVKGRIPDIPVSLNLNRGWNGVSLFPCEGEVNEDGKIVKIGSLEQLSKDLSAQGIKATQIAFWSAASQSWDVHTLPYDGQIDDNVYEDRLIMANQGFFLLLPDENGLYIPGLEFGENPPFPHVVEVARITNNTAVEWELTICGDKIVWTDNRDGDFDIYMYDISTGKETKIIEVPIESSNGLPRLAVHGNKIVWSDDRSGNADIYMYDLATGQETRITDNAAVQTNPAIYGDRIVWQDNRNGNNFDIYMYDLSTGEEIQITTDPDDQSEPAIYKDKIVWEDRRDLYPLIFPHIYMYDLLRGTEVRISTNSDEMQIDPDIYEDKIVWTDFRHNNPRLRDMKGSNSDHTDYKEEIYMYDISTGEEIRITTAPGQQYGPAIQGGKIVWTDTRNGEGDIYMYDISTGKEVRITVDPTGQHYPDIYEDKIVWIKEGAGSRDIYLGVLHGKYKTLEK